MEKARIGRNDPCPCGSGKKYKKCCGKNIASIDLILETELEQVQRDLMRWTMSGHKREIDAYLAPYYDRLALNHQTKQMYQYFAATWYINAVLREDGTTLLQKYIDTRKKALSDRVKNHLNKWQQAVPSVFRVTGWDGVYVFAEDLFTNEVKRVKAAAEGLIQREKGIAIGTILPAGNSYVFLATFFHIPEASGETATIENEVRNLFTNSNAENTRDWMAGSFLDVIERFMFESNDEVLNANEADKAVEQKKEEETVKSDLAELGEVQQESGLAPDHEKVAQIFHAYALGYDLPDYAQEFGNELWKTYCERTNPTLRKPEVAVAALVYLVETIRGGRMTQAELARLYEVSATSISSRYKAMCKELADEIEEMSRKVPENIK
ncbi:SEC-C metal-binding domain-containing protein [Aciduricibacillus chroicocephali]|uniref:SEC-C metal-binding domain-containing protein n=1 Tax=Aciduricibacillus chroicocephali TaxID=3054939 RepID=A0ABY9KU67_9BACI|nr:SEC-C metal-binding domain-containing protein [Bacillaceae bacterium 44XB]